MLQDDKNLYFVFEQAANGTLDELIQRCRGQMGEEITRIMFAQLVNFIEFIQKEGIMHRDMKPQNIMMDENFNCKLIDFGDARKVDEQLDEEEEQEDPHDPQDGDHHKMPSGPS